MMIRAAAVACLILLGCSGDKKSPPAAESPAPAVSEDAARPAAPPEDAARRAPIPRQKVELDPAQRKTLRAHRAAGSKLAKAEKWSEAVVEYEQALALDPSSSRTFSELSWVAFKAGDYQKAREAARASVELSSDPDVAAASLYNEGRAFEAMGESDQAKASYVESLRRRPNQTVRKRLVDLGGEPPVATAPPAPCATPAPKAELCKCLAAIHGAGTTCDPEGKPVGPVRVWTALYGNERTTYTTYYLVAESPAGLAAVGELARDVVDSPWVNTELEVKPIRKRSLGDHTVYEIETRLNRYEDSDAVERLMETSLTLCVEDGGAVRCPLRIPTERRFTARLESEDDESVVDFQRTYHGKPPIERRHRLKVDLAADGQITVTLELGARTAELERYLGQHRLW